VKALLVSCYGFHYDIRFKYVRSILEERDFQVKLVFSSFDHLEKQSVTYEDSAIIGIQVPSYQKNISVKRLYSHVVFASKLKKVLALEKPDLIVADIPPNTIGRSVAWYKKQNENCKVIFDVLDLWPESFSRSKVLMVPFWFWKKIRTSALPKADYVTLECDYYKRFLRSDLKEEHHSTLYLCKSPMKKPLEFSHPKEALSFCYLGSMNNIINIFDIVRMLKDVNKKRKVKLTLIGDGENREFFIEQLKVHGIEVDYLGLVFDETLKNDALKGCHFGINMYKNNVIVGLTMKSIDYFRVGLPTVNMNIYDTGILVKQYQSGFELSMEGWDNTVHEIINLQKEEWEKLHENTLQMFQEQFSVAVFEKNFNQVLERCGINQ